MAERANTNRRLASTASVTLGTRSLSVVSQALIAASFGASASLDGFYLALVIPALVATPVATAIELVLAPACTDARRRHLGRAFATRFLTLGVLSGTAIAATLAISAPLLVDAISSAAPTSTQTAAHDAARFLLPAAGLRLVVGVLSGLHLGAGRVNAPIVFRIVNPAALITALLLTSRRDASMLAMASLAGDGLELTCSLGWYWLRERHLPLSFRLPRLRFPGVAPSVAVLAGSQAIVQLAPAADQAIVASAGAGAVTTFVLGVRFFDVAKGVLLLPNARLAQLDLARASPDQLPEEARTQVRRALRIGALATLLAGVTGPIFVLAVLRRGAFTSADAWTTIAVIEMLVLGAVAVAVGIVAARALVVAGRTGFVVRVNIAFAVLSIVLDLLLVGPFGAPGVAAATSIAHVALAAVQVNALRPTG